MVDFKWIHISLFLIAVLQFPVKWLYAGKDVDKDNTDLQTSQSVCSASVRLQSSHFIQSSNSDLLKCEVTDGDRVKQFPFRLQPSGEKPGDDTRKTKPRPEPKTKPTTTPTSTTTTPRTPTATTMATKPQTKPTPTTTERSMKRGTITTASATNDDSANLKGDQKAWWWIIVALAVAAALLIVVVAVIRWKRTKGPELKPCSDSRNQPGPADPEGDVSYASVSFTKNSDSEGRVQGQGDDAVTYTTLKASSSSAAASADNHVLYATVNKPNK
ncbi:hypothetical protein GBF38_006303 [Nibea albiflora]|uniref:Uncharacterized protein n=1 Tax=Nibea albiflora TaxID=240163 RepID=A0ACB7FB27_NIBAL|nr:hypothetical protein GBF38_006303 [Nibea albiflora]